MNDVKITIWEAEPISDLQQDSDSQRATVQQHIYSGELSRSYAEQPGWRESRAVTGIQLEEKQVNTEFNRSQEKILAWPRLSQCCSGNWTFCWRLECEAGRYCVCCRSRTSGSAPGVEDAQLDRNNLPEGLMTSKKREFLICSGGRVGATSGTLCSTFYRYHVRVCRLSLAWNHFTFISLDIWTLLLVVWWAE